MNVSEIKLVNFESMVLREAEEKRNAIIEELAKQKKEKLARIEKELREKAAQKLKRELANISKEKNEQTVHKQLLCKQAVLGERQILIDGIFEGVKKRLDGYMQSEEYKKNLLDTIANAKNTLASASVVQITRKDEALADKIAALGFEVEYLDSSEIGGCIVIDKANGIRIDETFSRKLEAAKDSFLETYNLKI